MGGHNLGMAHDFSTAHAASGCDGTGIMSYGNPPNQWSTCSKADFTAQYKVRESMWLCQLPQVPVVELLDLQLLHQPLYLQPLHLHLHLPTVLEMKTGLVTIIAMMKTTMLLANLMEETAVTIICFTGIGTVQPVNVWKRPVLEMKTGLVTIIAMMKTTMLRANLMEVTAVTILCFTGIGTVQHVNACLNEQDPTSI